VYSEAREGGTNLFWQRADGTSPPERLTTSPGNQIPTSISPDGKLVIFHGGGLAAAAQLVGSGNRLMSLQLDGKSQPQPLLKTAFNERNGDISPNGHWLVYDSDQSGRNEVYVRPFPDVTAGLVQVSSGGGERPMWARDGRELFYLDTNGVLTSVAVQTNPAFSAGRAKQVLETKYFAGGMNANISGRAYDVSADGQRFIMIKEIASPPQPATPPVNLVVVLNLQEELNARLASPK
jgi:serine/threonine-protein kinase